MILVKINTINKTATKIHCITKFILRDVDILRDFENNYFKERWYSICHQGKTKYYFSHWSTCVKRLTFPIFALHMELYVLWKLFSWCSELKLNFKCEGPRSNKWYFTRLCSTFHSFKQYCLSTNFQSHKKSETPNPVK